jgi:hypothetical protein
MLCWPQQTRELTITTALLASHYDAVAQMYHLLEGIADVEGAGRVASPKDGQTCRGRHA